LPSGPASVSVLDWPAAPSGWRFGAPAPSGTASGTPDGKAATQVTLFDQGVLQTLQAAVTGLTPKKPYVFGAPAPSGTASGT
jgi:hypothetical protein